MATCTWCGKATKRRHYCSLKCKGLAERERHRGGHEPPPPVPDAVWIPLADGRFALVDADVASEIRRYAWSGGGAKGQYAMTTIGRRTVYLHHMVTPGSRLDHRNGNKLDCRRGNLRRATQRQNMANVACRAKSAPYKGIAMQPNGRWCARIRMPDGSRPSLGTYGTPEEAARAYDVAARAVHGEFACVNFPVGDERGALQ